MTKKKPEKKYCNKIRLDSPRAVQRLLSRTVNMLLDETLSLEKSKAIGYLANIMFNGFEKSDLKDKIDELEKLVKGDK